MWNRIDQIDMSTYLNFLEAWIEFVRLKNRRKKKLKNSDWIRLNFFCRRYNF